MLYLTRKIGQSIVINDKIEVKLVEIKGRTVKLGIEFPKTTTVLRKEVYDSVVEQNLASQMGEIQESFFEAIAKESAEDKQGG